MPWAEQETLTPAQVAQLKRADRGIEDARREWARLVRRFGISATARYYGVTPSALRQRVKRAEG